MRGHKLDLIFSKFELINTPPGLSVDPHGKNRFCRGNESTLVVLYLVIKPI